MSTAFTFRTADVRLLFITRALRLFSYGFLALVLWLYLAKLGLNDERIGLLMTMTLLGDVAVSLAITTSADRVGRKRMLIAGAALMGLAGVVFLATNDFWLLLAAATVGVISPTGNEVGPFLAVEQAALAQLVPADQRTHVFAWYNLTGSVATAFGSLLCGLLVQVLQKQGFSDLDSYRIVLMEYAVAGALLALLFLFLSRGAEAPAPPPPHPSLPLQGGGRVRGRSFLGLHQSRGVVLRLSGLFALDALGGGFVIQSAVVQYFHVRFPDADLALLGALFWGANMLAGFSALAAAAVARRIGLLRTMVVTHVPSNVLLILVPFMPNLPLAATVLLLRFSISQMDVPTRQSYTAAVVRPNERAAAAGVTGVARTAGAALAPAAVGRLLADPMLAGAPFVIAGTLKLVYDGLLYWLFRTSAPPEEEAARTVK